MNIDAMIYGSFGLAIGATDLQGCRKCHFVSGTGLTLCRVNL
jgi:hypothetical protein